MKATPSEHMDSVRRRKRVFRQRICQVAIIALVLTLLASLLISRTPPLPDRAQETTHIGVQGGDVWRGLRNHAVEEEGVKKPCNLQGTTNKRVLVTGAAGFIGYHTAHALQQRGDAVMGLDSFTDYYPVIMKREREQLLGIDVIEGDLNDQEMIRSLLEECGITHVVHLAAQAGVRYAKEHPMKYIESNVRGTVALFEAASHIDRPPSVVYASSSSVYGSNSKAPFSESDAVDHPTSLYGASKRSTELMAVVYHRLYNLSLTGLRFFTVYGPMGRPDMASFQFAKAIVKQKPIKIFTSPDGKELARDFTFIDDIVRGILAAVDQIPPSRSPNAQNEIYNLGNTHPVTVTAFVRSLERAMGQETQMDYMKVKNNGDVFFTHADVSKAKNAFGFIPEVGLDEGLDRFASWFKNYSRQMPEELWAYEQSL